MAGAAMDLRINSGAYFATVRFGIRHEGCWTELTGENTVKVHTLISKPFKEKNCILGVIEVKSMTLDAVKRFLHSFKRSKKIMEILEITPVNYQRKLFKVAFREVYDGMVSSLLYEHSSIYQNDLISGDVEHITAVIPKSEVNRLYSDLSSLGTLSYYRLSNADAGGQAPVVLDLTDAERDALVMAFRLGYYVIPRTFHLEDMCAMLNLSKSTLQEYLRRAENKILAKWMYENSVEA